MWAVGASAFMRENGACSPVDIDHGNEYGFIVTGWMCMDCDMRDTVAPFLIPVGEV